MRRLAVAALAAALAVPAAARDPRAVELVKLACASELGRRDVTLFESGTLRQRTWDADGELEMRLVDLPPDAVEPFLERVRSLDLSEVDEEPPAGPGGWVESCDLTLALEEGRTTEMRYSAAGSPPLALARLAGWVEELALRAAAEARTRSLPDGYAPAPGDVLLRYDGLRYEVLGWTSDGKALELAGLDRPVTLYVFPQGLAAEFVARVEADER